MGKRYAGLILAAGYSSRMGKFTPQQVSQLAGDPVLKALLPFGGETLIERQIHCFASAGVNDVYIVVGHRAEEIIRTISRYPVKTIYNENYPDGMFTSVQTGTRAMCTGNFDGVFLLPVDYALTQPFTISLLAHRFERGRANVVYPCFGGRKGHPPLFASSLIPEILAAVPGAGLKSVFELHKDEAEYVDMGNPTCLVDIDSTQDYASAMEYLERHIAPDMDECAFIYKHFNVPERVIKHCAKVAATAKTIAERLRDNGFNVDPDLVFYSGLMHDIRKGAGNHAAKAADSLSSMGYPKAARLVANHMELSEEYASMICNESILFFADKITEQEATVDIERRLSLLNTKYAGDNERMKNMQKRLLTALNIQSLINAALVTDVMQIVMQNDR